MGSLETWSAVGAVGKHASRGMLARALHPAHALRAQRTIDQVAMVGLQVLIYLGKGGRPLLLHKVVGRLSSGRGGREDRGWSDPAQQQQPGQSVQGCATFWRARRPEQHAQHAAAAVRARHTRQHPSEY